jgi:hypothetical protein
VTQPVQSLPAPALALARAIGEAGGRALVVGGWVRDCRLGLASKDVDLEAYGLDGASLRRVLERVGQVDAVGEAFTVYKVAGVDVSLPRRESKAGRGHRAFEVHGDPYMSPTEAARRRDFTINAIMADPLTGEVLDPFNGQADLEARVLRMVDAATFADDSLRVLRALQFAARFELEMDPATKAVCRGIALDDLPSERVFSEVEKLLLQARRFEAWDRQQWLWETWRFVRMIFPLLIVGVFLVGVIRIFIRPEWIQAIAGANTVTANLAGVVFGVFMYFPTLVEVPIAKMFLSLGMHPGPLIAYLMADPELSLQSILITAAIIGKLKAWTYVGLVAVFATASGLAYGAWVDGVSAAAIALAITAFVGAVIAALHCVDKYRAPATTRPLQEV